MARAASLLVLAALSVGFEWPGRVQRLTYELDHADAPQRRELVRQLAGYAPGAVEAALLGALEDEDPGVREEAALAAGRVKLAEATPILRDWLDDKDAATRAIAATALASFGDATARDVLVRALADTRAEVRRAAVPAVAAIGGAEVVAPLLSKLDDADISVRVAVVQALAGLADARAILPLGARARDDASEVREAVMLALGQLGDPRSLAVVEQGLADGSEAVRIAAAASLGRIGDARAVPALVRTLRSSDARMAQAVVAALANIDPQATAGPDEKPAADGDTKIAAADAPDTTADARGVEALLDRLETGAASDRHAVLDALGGTLARLDRTRTLPARVRQRALHALAQASLLADRESADRALDALVAWRPTEGLAAVAAHLRMPSSRRRARAAFALGAFHGTDARGVLRYLVQHDTPAVVVAATAALGEIGEQRDVAALVKLARRMHWPVPAAVAWAIARMAERGVLKEHATQRLLCDIGRTREPYVRANVAAVMGTWGAAACPDGGPDSLTWLARATSPAVRVAAARWAHAAAASGRLDAAVVRAALSACAARDPDASVRLACHADEATTEQREPRDIAFYAYAPDGVTPLRDTLVALRLRNGSVFVGATDANAHLRLLSTAGDALVLEDPGLAALEPE